MAIYIHKKNQNKMNLKTEKILEILEEMNQMCDIQWNSPRNLLFQMHRYRQKEGTVIDEQNTINTIDNRFD